MPKTELSFYFVIGSSGIKLIYNPNGTMWLIYNPNGTLCEVLKRGIFLFTNSG